LCRISIPDASTKFPVPACGVGAFGSQGRAQLGRHVPIAAERCPWGPQDPCFFPRYRLRRVRRRLAPPPASPAAKDGTVSRPGGPRRAGLRQGPLSLPAADSPRQGLNRPTLSPEDCVGTVRHVAVQHEDEGPERGGCPQHEHGSYRDCVHAPSTYDSRANLMARSGAIRHLVALLKRCRRGRQTSSSTLARHARCRQAVPTARASASRIAFTGAWMDDLRGTPISRSWVTSGDCIGTARTPMPLAMPWA
jgi:hypothetical protein